MAHMESAGSAPRARRLDLSGVPITSLLIAALVLLLWEYASRQELISNLFFPPPSVIWERFLRFFATDEWLQILTPTLKRLLFGMAGGVGVGYMVGIAIGSSHRLFRVIDPMISFFYPIPKISLLPLALVIFGLGDTSRQLIIAASAFFPMAINTTAAVHAIDANYFAIARVYGASRWARFRRILLPGSLPLVFSGFRIAFNTAFIVTISVELASSNDGVGRVIWRAWQTFRTEELYAGILLIALIGVVTTRLFSFSQKRLIRWQPPRTV